MCCLLIRGLTDTLSLAVYFRKLGGKRRISRIASDAVTLSSNDGSRRSLCNRTIHRRIHEWISATRQDVSRRVLQGMTSGFLEPAIAAISLGVVGHSALAERLGRNQRFASAGVLVTTGLMGLV